VKVHGRIRKIQIAYADIYLQANTGQCIRTIAGGSQKFCPLCWPSKNIN